MAQEQESGEAKSKAGSGLLIVSGCMLVVVAMSSDKGPLQWLLYAAAIGTLLYAALLAAKIAKKKKGRQ